MIIPDETLREWSMGRYSDGYPHKDIAELSAQLLEARRIIRVLASEHAQLSVVPAFVLE